MLAITVAVGTAIGIVVGVRVSVADGVKVAVAVESVGVVADGVADGIAVGVAVGVAIGVVAAIMAVLVSCSVGIEAELQSSEIAAVPGARPQSGLRIRWKMGRSPKLSRCLMARSWRSRRSLTQLRGSTRCLESRSRQTAGAVFRQGDRPVCVSWQVNRSSRLSGLKRTGESDEAN